MLLMLMLSGLVVKGYSSGFSVLMLSIGSIFLGYGCISWVFISDSVFNSGIVCGVSQVVICVSWVKLRLDLIDELIIMFNFSVCVVVICCCIFCKLLVSVGLIIIVCIFGLVIKWKFVLCRFLFQVIVIFVLWLKV